MTTTEMTTQNENLRALAGKAAAEMVQVMRDHQSALAHAIKAGELLLEAKSLLRHGEWEPWLEQHFGASARTARTFMRLSKKSADPAVLEANSIAGALEALAKPKQIAASSEDDTYAAKFRALPTEVRLSLRKAMLDDLSSRSMFQEILDVGRAWWAGHGIDRETLKTWSIEERRTFVAEHKPGPLDVGRETTERWGQEWIDHVHAAEWFWGAELAVKLEAAQVEERKGWDEREAVAA
jgi:hypothetical protein